VSLLFIGFLLGIRHATDADHIVAIATIVSRQRHLWGSAMIGAVRGIGHTLTILVVGGASLPMVALPSLRLILAKPI
jgi:high-affinity nickel-transport protein